MTDRFSIKSDTFEGPLDALLNLIEERKLSISEVHLANVCDGFLAYVEALPEMPLGETAQFILIASTLLLIKSRSLLPTLELSTQERESVEELERRLAKLALIRKGARELRQRWGAQPRMLARIAPARPAQFSPAVSTLPGILAAARQLIGTLPKGGAALREAAVAPVRALEEVIAEVRARLRSAARARFSELTVRASREDLIVYFLAMLELVRSGSASVSQERLFSDIMIEIEQTGLPQYGL